MNSKQNSNIWGTCAGVMVVLGTLILLLPMGADASHCKGKHKNDPGCGSSEIAVSTTIGNSSGIQSDSSGAYIHNVENVQSLFNTSGYFVLTMHKRQNRPGSRKVFWSLPQTVDLGGIEIDGTDDIEIAGKDHKTVIQVGKFTGVDLRALAVGESASDVDMILDLMLFNGNKSTGDVLLVRYSPDGSQCGGNSTDGVTVTRLGDAGGKRHWAITPDGNNACMYTFDDDYGTGNSFGAFMLTVDEL